MVSKSDALQNEVNACIINIALSFLYFEPVEELAVLYTKVSLITHFNLIKYGEKALAKVSAMAAITLCSLEIILLHLFIDDIQFVASNQID